MWDSGTKDAPDSLGFCKSILAVTDILLQSSWIYPMTVQTVLPMQTILSSIFQSHVEHGYRLCLLRDTEEKVKKRNHCLGFPYSLLGILSSLDRFSNESFLFEYYTHVKDLNDTGKISFYMLKNDRSQTFFLAFSFSLLVFLSVIRQIKKRENEVRCRLTIDMIKLGYHSIDKS